MKKLFAFLLFTCWHAIAQNDLVMPPPDKPSGALLIGKDDDNAVYDQAGLAIKPQYPGGMEAFYAMVSKNLRAPAIEQENDITLKVYITFVIEKDGSLTNINVLRDPGYGFGIEAKRVIALSGKWTPGVIEGKPIRAKFYLPITMKIEGTVKNEKPIEETPPTGKSVKKKE
jgi:periplasmic protein TonB